LLGKTAGVNVLTAGNKTCRRGKGLNEAGGRGWRKRGLSGERIFGKNGDPQRVSSTGNRGGLSYS